MKIRNGFVSNSSSSSFVIHKGFLSEEQIEKIFNYIDIVEEYLKENPIPNGEYYEDPVEFDFSYSEWGWGIKEFDDCIFGETSMDNFSFDDFFRYIGVNLDDICWDEGYIDSPTPKQLEFINQQNKKLRKLKLKNLKNE